MGLVPGSPIYTGCIKKVNKSEINVRSFFIKIDCFGTCDVELTGKNEKLKTSMPGGGGEFVSLNSIKFLETYLLPNLPTPTTFKHSNFVHHF